MSLRVTEVHITKDNIAATYVTSSVLSPRFVNDQRRNRFSLQQLWLLYYLEDATPLPVSTVWFFCGCFGLQPIRCPVPLQPKTLQPAERITPQPDNYTTYHHPCCLLRLYIIKRHNLDDRILILARVAQRIWCALTLLVHLSLLLL
jgi:hypothetical protein